MTQPNNSDGDIKLILSNLGNDDEIAGNWILGAIIVGVVLGILMGVYSSLTYEAPPEPAMIRITSNEQNGFMLGCINHSEYAVCEERWLEYARRK